VRRPNWKRAARIYRKRWLSAHEMLDRINEKLDAAHDLALTRESVSSDELLAALTSRRPHRD
jgi:hypothetical protein